MAIEKIKKPKRPPEFWFFQLPWVPIIHFYVKSTATYGPTFWGYINSFLAIVISSTQPWLRYTVFLKSYSPSKYVTKGPSLRGLGCFITCLLRNTLYVKLIKSIEKPWIKVDEPILHRNNQCWWELWDSLYDRHVNHTGIQTFESSAFFFT